MDAIELDENWKRACRADPLLSRFEPPRDDLPLLEAVLDRVVGNPNPPNPILQGLAVGFVGAAWETNGEASYLQLAYLVAEAAKAPGVVVGAAVETLRVVGQASVNVLLAAWRIQAEEDQLTHLGNRRRMETHVAGLVAANTEFEYASIDLDGLKAINDGPGGHAEGDDYLRAAGDGLRLHLAQRGTAYRYGGDEFGVVRLLEPEQPALAGVLAGVETAIAPIRFSYGVARWPDDDPDVASVINIADRRMYEMKVARRNG